MQGDNSQITNYEQYLRYNKIPLEHLVQNLMSMPFLKLFQKVQEGCDTCINSSNVFRCIVKLLFSLHPHKVPCVFCFQPILPSKASHPMLASEPLKQIRRKRGEEQEEATMGRRKHERRVLLMELHMQMSVGTLVQNKNCYCTHTRKDFQQPGFLFFPILTCLKYKY